MQHNQSVYQPPGVLIYILSSLAKHGHHRMMLGFNSNTHSCTWSFAIVLSACGCFRAQRKVQLGCLHIDASATRRRIAVKSSFFGLQSPPDESFIVFLPLGNFSSVFSVFWKCIEHPSRGMDISHRKSKTIGFATAKNIHASEGVPMWSQNSPNRSQNPVWGPYMQKGLSVHPALAMSSLFPFASSVSWPSSRHFFAPCFALWSLCRVTHTCLACVQPWMYGEYCVTRIRTSPNALRSPRRCSPDWICHNSIYRYSQRSLQMRRSSIRTFHAQLLAESSMPTSGCDFPYDLLCLRRT
jgi:hypothetical protein